MSFFKFDETNVSSGFELVAEGKYEAFIQNAVSGFTSNQEQKLTVDFEIRSDYEQPHKGAKVLYNTFTFSHDVSVRIVNSLIKAAGFANGHPFTSAQDMANQLKGRNLEITVKHEPYEKIVDGVKKQFTSAKAKYYDVSKINGGNNSNSVSVEDSDLPF